MNNQFLKDATEIVENLTPEEIAKGLKEHGIKAISVHSGKPLSELLYDDIFIGMDVVNPDGLTGVVQEVHGLQDVIRVNWSNGSWTEQAKRYFDKVIVTGYSGTKLSEVPYDRIYIGMELISAMGNPGKVVDKIPKEEVNHRENDSIIVCEWSSNATSYQLHHSYTKVTVK